MDGHGQSIGSSDAFNKREGLHVGRAVKRAMRFYFNHRDGDKLIVDDEGAELATVGQARALAAVALGEHARDALPKADRMELAIEVSDEHRTPLFRVALWYEIQPVS